ncbi:IspD/TarI family cytidylyltransferase [Isoptericola cucumis]|uniref:2-C-methyl-D-erythritol 4-phosphate cytidylyltransferase n=1 Tax=Isoptericola cucumis TaxID=1776856 RepID=A0ABQ2BAT0_9MICO|nr:2-C-methyl-D-erythritol 4-phosphate cytidylyltransferase [Isoptericola cucumis]GGI09862.1 2-C-methyl-D-erythritol 4-phosphate cytidylyltransferase [Isoptericola cucumis]
MYKSHKVSAIVTCAGRGVRFGGNKLLVKINGVTILEKTVREFVHPAIDEIIVTISPENREVYHDILIEKAGLPVTLVDGGEERFISARLGLQATSGGIVMVHDGVRPFVNSELIERVLEAGVENGAAMLGMPTVVQLKTVDDDEFITGSLDRSHSWLGQTPQVFQRELLAKAYDEAIASSYHRVSDDADLVAEFTGHRVKIVKGEDYNIKITTRTDLVIADQIMAQADWE